MRELENLAKFTTARRTRRTIAGVQNEDGQPGQQVVAQSFSLALELDGSGRGEELDDAEEMPEVDIEEKCAKKD